MDKIVSSLWIGGNLSPLEQLSIESFLQNGHEYQLYCYDRLKGIPKGAKVCDASEILPRSDIFTYESGPGAGSVAAFANLFRYKLLLERGGWWMDTDMICLRPLDFDAPIVFASELALGKVQVTNSAIKLPRGSAIAKELFAQARQQKDARTVWGATGPALIERIVRKNNLESLVQPPEIFCPWQFGEWDKLLRAESFEDVVSSQSYTIHMWHEGWRRMGMKLHRKGGLVPAKPRLLRKIFPKPRPCRALASLLQKYPLPRFSVFNFF